MSTIVILDEGPSAALGLVIFVCLPFHHHNCCRTVLDQHDRDGRFWTRIECNASDENNASYRFVFRSNGTPVNVQHSRPVTTRHPIATVDPKVVADIIARFRGATARNGIQGVVTDLEACFEDSIGNVPAIRACVLYDMAAMRLDKDMRKLFESRGVNLEAPPFLTDRAFRARIEMYSGMAFDGSESMALRYFGTAPSVVIGGLTN